MRGVVLNEVQTCLMEMMVDIDRRMREKGVMYSIDSGTAIGAVRHKGFIPWDDDIDLIILRKDVDAFVKAFRDMDGYYLQEPFSVDWPYLYFRIRKDGTTFIDHWRKNSRMHQGLFVDVFVMEDYPNSPTARKLYNLIVDIMMDVQRYNERSYLLSNLEVVSRLVMFTVRRMNSLLDMLVGKDPEYITHRTWFRDVKTYPKKWFTSTSDVEFEGHMLKMSDGYDEILRLQYGDYMQLPPVEERVNRHVVFFSKDIDYRDYLSADNERKDDLKH